MEGLEGREGKEMIEYYVIKIKYNLKNLDC